MKDLKSEMTEDGFFTTRRRFKIPSNMGLRVIDAKMRPNSLPERYISIIEDVLQCGIQVPLLPYFQNLLEHYGIALM